MAAVHGLENAPLVFLYAHHGRNGAVRLGHDIKRAAHEIVAAENSLVGLKSLFVGLLVPLTSI